MALHDRRVDLKDATANFTDNTTPQPVKLSITPLQLKVQQISDDLSRPLPVDLQATLNKKGTLGVKGDVTATPLKLAVKVNANRLDAAAFEPYFGSKLNAVIASALLNANGDLDADSGEGAEGELSRRHGARRRADARQGDLRPVRGLGLARVVQPEGRLRRARHGGRRGPRDLHEVLWPRAARRAGQAQSEGRGRA